MLTFFDSADFVLDKHPIYATIPMMIVVLANSIIAFPAPTPLARTLASDFAPPLSISQAVGFCPYPLLAASTTDGTSMDGRPAGRVHGPAAILLLQTEQLCGAKCRVGPGFPPLSPGPWRFCGVST